MDQGNGTTVGLTDAQRAAKPTATPVKTKGTKGTVTRNPRIVAVSKISNILDGLDEDTRSFAVRFIVEEYKGYVVND